MRETTRIGKLHVVIEYLYRIDPRAAVVAANQHISIMYSSP